MVFIGSGSEPGVDIEIEYTDGHARAGADASKLDASIAAMLRRMDRCRAGRLNRSKLEVYSGMPRCCALAPARPIWPVRNSLRTDSIPNAYAYHLQLFLLWYLFF
jgi:hypothetical protein